MALSQQMIPPLYDFQMLKRLRENWVQQKLPVKALITFFAFNSASLLIQTLQRLYLKFCMNALCTWLANGNDVLRISVRKSIFMSCIAVKTVACHSGW